MRQGHCSLLNTSQQVTRCVPRKAAITANTWNGCIVCQLIACAVISLCMCAAITYIAYRASSPRDLYHVLSHNNADPSGGAADRHRERRQLEDLVQSLAVSGHALNKRFLVLCSHLRPTTSCRVCAPHLVMQHCFGTHRLAAMLLGLAAEHRTICGSSHTSRLTAF